MFNDGGTRWIKITDAEGQKFDVYIDHRIDTKTRAHLRFFGGCIAGALVFILLGVTFFVMLFT